VSAAMSQRNNRKMKKIIAVVLIALNIAACGKVQRNHNMPGAV
jgi:hypothetical protein